MRAFRCLVGNDQPDSGVLEHLTILVADTAVGNDGGDAVEATQNEARAPQEFRRVGEHDQLVRLPDQRQFGLDDAWSWGLIPLVGFTIAGCALTAIVFGLMEPEKWNARFNPAAPADAASGRTNWFTIGAIVLSLLIGTSVLMASIVFSFQRYFEYQIVQARQISQ